MPTETQLNGLLNADGGFRIVLFLAQLVNIALYVVTMLKSNELLKFFKITKMVELIIVIAYSVWYFIYNIVAATTYHQYFKFIEVVAFLNMYIYLAGAILTFLGVRMGRRRLLLGQILVVVYTIVQFITLLAIFVGAYSTAFLRVADILVFITSLTVCGLGTILTLEADRKMSNDPFQRGSSGMSKDDASGGIRL